MQHNFKKQNLFFLDLRLNDLKTCIVKKTIWIFITFFLLINKLNGFFHYLLAKKKIIYINYLDLKCCFKNQFV